MFKSDTQEPSGTQIPAGSSQREEQFFYTKLHPDAWSPDPVSEGVPWHPVKATHLFACIRDLIFCTTLQETEDVEFVPALMC